MSSGNVNVKTGTYFLLLLITGLLLYSITASSTPDGVTITIGGNTTKSASAGGIANYSGNDTTRPEMAGGFIFFMNITGETQNVRWKAFVGNA